MKYLVDEEEEEEEKMLPQVCMCVWQQQQQQQQQQVYIIRTHTKRNTHAHAAPSIVRPSFATDSRHISTLLCLTALTVNVHGIVQVVRVALADKDVNFPFELAPELHNRVVPVTSYDMLKVVVLPPVRRHRLIHLARALVPVLLGSTRQGNVLACGT